MYSHPSFYFPITFISVGLCMIVYTSHVNVQNVTKVLFFKVKSSHTKMEKFCLKWNDFQSNVSKTFSYFRTEESFFDVTLVSDDHHHIAAHKLVLSASSKFFKDILCKSQHSNPLIYLSGFSSKDLNLVMDYIYQGEVQIYQDDLDNFLNVAQKLNIEGLIGGSQPSEDNDFFQATDGLFKQTDSTDSTEEFQETVDNFKLKTPFKPRQEKKVVHPTTTLVNQLSSIDDVKATVDELLERDGELWICKTCGKSSSRKSDMNKHVEIHIEGLSYGCQLCGQTFRSRNILNHHKIKNHK